VALTTGSVPGSTAALITAVLQRGDPPGRSRRRWTSAGWHPHQRPSTDVLLRSKGSRRRGFGLRAAAATGRSMPRWPTIHGSRPLRPRSSFFILALPMFQERLWEIVGLSLLKELYKPGNLRRVPRPAYAEPFAFGGLEVSGARLLLFDNSFERTQEREFFVGHKLITFFRRLLLKHETSVTPCRL
jgi:hypothetical protein